MTKILFAVSLSFLLAAFAYYKKALTNPALILAFIFSCLITYFGGLSSFLILAAVFMINHFAGKIKTTERFRINSNILKKMNQKDVMEIIANVATGTTAIIIYALTSNINFLVIYACIVAESLADSLGSDIGVLSKKDPINILTFKRSKPGLSGNISLLGIFASFLGSLVIGLIFYLFHSHLAYLIIITLCGTLGNLIDSFLGALLQVKYQCPKCHIITEQETHCGTKTTKVKGSPIFDNDIVNLLTNIIAGVLGYLLLII